jgi:hypothetical protein
MTWVRTLSWVERDPGPPALSGLNEVNGVLATPLSPLNARAWTFTA